MPRSFIAGCLVVLLAGLTDPAHAQSSDAATRAEALRQQRENKKQSVAPNEADGLQRGLDYVEDRAIYLLTREGWYPKIGSLTTGSGFAIGAGYRDRDLLRHHGVIEAWGAGTFKRYWASQARVAFPELANGRVFAEASANLREYPQESFFGLGPGDRRVNDADFMLRMADVGGRAGVHIWPVLTVGAGAAVFSSRWSADFADEGNTVETASAFQGVPTPPGRQDFVRTDAFVEVDYRQPLNARRGGWYRLDIGRYHDRDGGAWSFTRTDVDVRQYVGFLADRRVIALRGWLSTTTADDNGAAPFYLMPTLGGNDSLRGFRNYRFRGPHAMLLQAEYRWELWSGLDAALFYDAGKVAMRRGDLDFDGLERDYGFGFRFNTSEGVIMRVDAAFGSRDGKHLHIVFGGVF